jgi:prepilin-type N-terminal cleavage/methylation domain-containing protein
MSVRRQRAGFTLIEVIVALGIAGGALILLLSANRGSIQRSLRANDRVRLEQACESKLNEICCGAETSTHGQIDGHVWDVTRETAEIEGISALQRVTLRIGMRSGSTISKSVLQYGKIAQADKR